MHYAIDGNNVLLDFVVNGKPSVLAFAVFLKHLQDRKDTYRLFFDDSISELMRKKGVLDEWKELERAIRLAGISLEFAPHADRVLQAYCNANKAALLNATDSLDSWHLRGPLPAVVHRAQLVNRPVGISLEVRADRSRELVSELRLPYSVVLGSVKFATPLSEERMARVITKSSRRGTVVTGTLLVFVLDASGSMGTRNTFDKKKKTEHLNEILRDSLRRLSNSQIGRGLYVAVLRFSDQVLPLSSPRGKEFAHVDDWRRSEGLDYLAGISMANTNIRAALRTAKKIIQAALVDRGLLREIATTWRATMILVTDGRHEVKRPDGSAETDLDVATAAREIHLGVTPTDDVVALEGNRIAVACVGIGTDLNHDLLLNISSACTEEQKQMATVAGIQDLLVEERLFIVVDSENPGYPDAIRTFIDIASSSAR